MANQHGSVWTQYPGLHDFAAAAVARGLVGRQLEAAVTEKFGIRVSAERIHDHLRSGHVPGAVEPSIPRELIEPGQGYATPFVPPAAIKHPTGWEPHVEERGDGTAIAVSQPLETENPDEAELIRGWKLDPALWRIVGPVNCRRWETAAVVGDGADRRIETKWLFYYRANLARRDRDVGDIVQLQDEIRTHKPAPAERPEGDAALVVGWADIQMGKGDGGGSAGIVQRCLARIDAVADHAKRLRRYYGRDLGTLYLFGMGDLVESCDGQYAQQAFRSDLNRRDQVKVVRRLLLKSLEAWSPLFARVVVGCVGGNHGENRKDGKSFTDFADNDDVAIFEQIEEICAENSGRYGHVSFRIPKDDLALTFDIHGTATGIAHGHQAGKAGASFVQKKTLDWWKGQAIGLQPIGSVRLLITAHYHHFSVIEHGGRTHVQCPTLDGGSDWHRNQSGLDSRPGILAMVVGGNVSPAGYRTPEVL